MYCISLPQMTPSADECAKVIAELNELYARYPQYPQEYFGNVKGVQKRYLVSINVCFEKNCKYLFYSRKIYVNEAIL